ncbi:MAG: GntR family transcriptional regulator [Lachnospiraceae bacterium]|nr:GntR family transcriptional regulator [Lachnospiraceae bacterium]
MAGKYRLITDRLELELKKMRAEGRTRLPSEQELATRFSCSRQTVRASLEVLRQKGLIEKRKGSGSYLAEDTFNNKTIFFITEDCDRYQSPAMISGLKEMLASSGYGLRAFSTGGTYQAEAGILTQVISERPAALVIEPSRDLVPNPDSRLTAEIAALGIPVIYCNSTSGPVHVTPDNVEGGRILTKQLLDPGSKKTACIFRIDSSTGRDRYQGYIDALMDFDADFDESMCLLITHEDEKEIISGKGDKLSAFVDNNLSGCGSVICQNGMIAHRMVNLLDNRGINVPQDIAVACFDNGYYADDGIISLGYDNDHFCKMLAKTVEALAGGRSASSAAVPWISIPSNQRIPG